MAKKSGGVMYPNPFNETNPGDAPDTDGDKLYYNWDEVMAMHLQEGDCSGTPNTESASGILGGPAPGEENPVGLRSPQK